MKDEALKLALEALEYLATQIKPDYEHNKAITAIKQARSAPVQEPKFWYDQEEGLLHDHFDDSPFGCIPLYTTPPAAQRQWVGLTDEEWQDLSDRYGMILFSRFKNEIETKLREKNTP
jgi:hypothetical protein